MTAPSILVRHDAGVCRIRIARPERRNALTREMYSAMVDAIAAADADPEILAIVFEGTADIFTSGNDIGEFMGAPPTGHDSPVFQFLLALIHAETPLVAAVRGPAIGIGTTMLLHFDLVYADDRAVFEMPFTRLALSPEGGSSMLLPQLCGLRNASELLLLSERFDAERGRELGLVNRVYGAASFEEAFEKQLERLLAMPPESVRVARRLLREPVRDALREAMEREGTHFIERIQSAEAREAFAAFLEKRAPDFASTRS